MTNKTAVQKDKMDKNKSVVTQTGKEDKRKNVTEKIAEKKGKRPSKGSSAILAASMGRSAVDAVLPHSSRDVRGSSGLADTGTVISYD